MKPENTISAEMPAWSREAVSCFWDPGNKLLRSIRRYQKARKQNGPLAILCSKNWVLVHRFWSVITQSEIHLNTQIGGDLQLPHPTGIVIHPEAIIGPNCMIFHQVTLAGAVVLGCHVDIGSGAKILGPLQIGDHANIAANAVVTKDVPANATAKGIPARVSN